MQESHRSDLNLFITGNDYELVQFVGIKSSLLIGYSVSILCQKSTAPAAVGNLAFEILKTTVTIYLLFLLYNFCSIIFAFLSPSKLAKSSIFLNCDSLQAGLVYQITASDNGV